MKPLLAGVLVAAGLHLSATATLVRPFAANRVLVVEAHATAGATCSLADTITGARYHGPSTATWRWRPSIWAHGIDTITVSCTKGKTRRTVKPFVLLQTLGEINVLRDYAVHLVYWAPDGGIAAGVPSAVTQFESDVKASLDGHATDNPFAIAVGYGDSLGNGDPRIASIDTTTDADPYPAPAKGYCRGVTTPCLGDLNFAREAERVARAHRWPGGNHTLVMFFTSSSVTACFRLAPNCTPSTEPEGFHDLSIGGYAFAEIVMSGLRPGDSISPADYAIALIGHEQNEAVVDPLANGVEIGDPCEGQFKSVQVNGHPYTLPALEAPTTRCAFTYTQ